MTTLSTACVSALLLAAVYCTTAATAGYEQDLRHSDNLCEPDDAACSENSVENDSVEQISKGPARYMCKLDDSQCLTEYMQKEVIGRFHTGIPEFGMQPFDPLFYRDLPFKYEGGNAVNIVLKHIKPVIRGLSRVKVHNVRTQVNGSDFTAQIHISIPELIYEGEYTVTGECMFVPIYWKGVFNMTMGNVTDTWRMKMTIVDKDDDYYLDLQQTTITLKMTEFNTYATGLFWGFEEAEGGGENAELIALSYGVSEQLAVAEQLVTATLPGAQSHVSPPPPLPVPPSPHGHGWVMPPASPPPPPPAPSSSSPPPPPAPSSLPSPSPTIVISSDEEEEDEEEEDDVLVF